jgi:hypothetical protein
MHLCISALRIAFDKVPGPLRAKEAALHFCAKGWVSLLKSATAGAAALTASTKTSNPACKRIWHFPRIGHEHRHSNLLSIAVDGG